MTSRCTICGNLAAREIVDRGLLAGERPADLLRIVSQPPLNIAASSLYRHCRSHSPKNVFRVLWIDGETTSGDVLSDLAGLRRQLFEQYRHQTERGDAAASSRSAHEAHVVSATLLKAGISEDGTIAQLAYTERIMKAVQRAARDRPAHASELAKAARDLEDFELAEDADELAANAEKYQSNLTTTGARA